MLWTQIIWTVEIRINLYLNDGKRKVKTRKGTSHDLKRITSRVDTVEVVLWCGINGFKHTHTRQQYKPRTNSISHLLIGRTIDQLKVSMKMTSCQRSTASEKRLPEYRKNAFPLGGSTSQKPVVRAAFGAFGKHKNF